jgi:ribosomal protein S18 acetylase RimI-like enzyme
MTIVSIENCCSLERPLNYSTKHNMTTNPQTTVKVRLAQFPDDKDTISSLFLAYEQHLLDTASVKLDFQNFSDELANLPGKYAVENNGALWLAYTSTPSAQNTPAENSPAENAPAENAPAENAPAKETPIGCMGLRVFTPLQAELKRLYLLPSARGRGASRMLMDVSIARARELGYKEVLLDTLGSMTAARKLYEKYGFREIEAYYDSHPEAVFYQLDLTQVEEKDT